MLAVVVVPVEVARAVLVRNLEHGRAVGHDGGAALLVCRAAIPGAHGPLQRGGKVDVAGGDVARLERLRGVCACGLHEKDRGGRLGQAGVVPGPDAVVGRDDDRGLVVDSQVLELADVLLNNVERAARLAHEGVVVLALGDAVAVLVHDVGPVGALAVDDAIGAALGGVGGREDGLAEALVHARVIDDVGRVLG